MDRINQGFRPPSQAQIRRLFDEHAITQEHAAEMAGLFDSAHVRKFLKPHNPCRVSFPLWFTWCAYTVINDQDIFAVDKLAYAAWDIDPSTPYAVYFTLACYILLSADDIAQINAACRHALRKV